MVTPNRNARGTPVCRARRTADRLWRLKLLVTLAVAGYACFVAALMTFETSLVYPGASAPVQAGSRPRPGTPVVTVEYEAADGTPLRGRLLDRTGTTHTVLFLHGNGEKAIWLDSWLSRLSAAFNANVMAAEFRGYHEDALTPSELGAITDSRAARAFLCTRYGLRPADIILYGRSLGGGCAAALAEDCGARAVVLERTFDRLSDVAAEKFPLIPVRLLMRNQYDSVVRMQNYRGPLVQVHGTADTLIPMHHGKRLFEAIPSDRKTWIAVPGLRHNDRLPEAVLIAIAGPVEAMSDLAQSR